MQKNESASNENQCEHCLTGVSEFGEHSPESRVDQAVTEIKQEGQLETRPQDSSTKQTCESNSSESSRESLDCNGNNVSVPKLSWFKSMTQIVGLTAAWHQDKAECMVSLSLFAGPG